jgi:hypothetical protein
MKTLFLAASAAFAAIPGVGVIASGLGTPPGAHYPLVFGGVIEAFGALSLVILWVNQKKLQRYSKRRITRAAIIIGVASFIFIGSYLLLFQHTVVEHPRGIVYFPLWLTGTIERRVQSAGSRKAAIGKYGPGAEGLQGAVDEMGTLPLALTSILLLSIYQGIFTSLTLAFGLLGFHMRQPMLGDLANAPPPT